MVNNNRPTFNYKHTSLNTTLSMEQHQQQGGAMMMECQVSPHRSSSPRPYSLQHPMLSPLSRMSSPTNRRRQGNGLFWETARQVHHRHRLDPLCPIRHFC